MTELIGDICAPSELILPVKDNSTKPNKTGELIMSGAKLAFYNGTAWELITSA